MTAATKVIYACCERTGWLEVSTGSNEALDEAIRLASFGVGACCRLIRGLRWCLGDNDGLVSGRAVRIRGVSETVRLRFRLGHLTELGTGDRGQNNEEH
jgi:hypothetical protein